MTTIPLTETLPHQQSRQSRRVKIGLAVAAGTAAAYGAARLFKRNSTETHHYQHRMKEWLSARLGELAYALDLTAELSDKMTKEIRSASRLAMKLSVKSSRTKPEIGDLLRIIADKRLLKMKQRLHKMLDLSDSSRANALHSFYEELHQWIFGNRTPASEATVNS